MQAVILVAGEGSRLYPFTKNKPKAMINLAGIPLLQFTFDQLIASDCNVNEFILITNYLKEKIEDYFGESYKGVKVSYIYQSERLGTGHALLMAKEKITGNFLMLYGDDLYHHKDINKLLNKPNSMLLHELEDVSNFGVVTVDGSGKVLEIIEKPEKEVDSNLINIGVFHFVPSVFDILSSLGPSKRGEIELTDAISEIAKQKDMHYFIAEVFWKPVGYPWHILDATHTILQHKTEILRHGSVEAGAMIENSVSVGRGSVVAKGTRIMGLVHIGENVKIKENCTIVGPCAISNGSVIGQGAVIENTVIGNSCVVGENSHLHHSVIGDRASVIPGVETEFNSPEENVHVFVKDKKVDSGLNQLGCFVADGCTLDKSTKPGDMIF